MRRTAALFVLSLVGASCVDTSSAYEGFNERLSDKKKREEAKLREMIEIPSGGCAALQAEQLSGRFLFGLTASPAPDVPLLALLTVEAEPTGTGLLANLKFEPLSVEDPTQTVGSLSIGELRIEGTELSAREFVIDLPGVANTVLPGADAAAELNLSGILCVAAEARVDELCGTVTGNLIEPLQVSMEGSEFGAVRIVEGEPWPKVLSGCKKDGVALP